MKRFLLIFLIFFGVCLGFGVLINQMFYRGFGWETIVAGSLVSAVALVISNWLSERQSNK